MTPLFTTIILALLLGLVAGAIMQRSDFCMTSAFRDLFLFRSTTMLAALLILVTVSSVFFEAIRLFGSPDPLLAAAFGPPALTTLLGGGIFGVGMVLAGGCVVGTLYRVGAGSRLSLWGVGGIVVGSAFYAEIHPFWKDLQQRTSFLGPQTMTLPQWIGLPPWLLVLGLTLVTAILFWHYPRAFAPFPNWREVDGYIPPPYAALVLAGVGTLSVIFFTRPLGVTTSYVKFAALLESLFSPGHLAVTPYFQTLLSPVVLPFAAGVWPAGTGTTFDGIAVIQYPIIFGIILGSALSAWHLGEWHWSQGSSWPQTISVLSGGVLMGLAARLSSGCNIWHLWGGLPIFSLQSLLFLLGIFPGAWLGGRLLIRWVLPEKDQGESE